MKRTIIGGAVAGMPNGMTGPELVAFWIDKASSAGKGFDAANGYDYAQPISKFVQGAVFYNRAVDRLDAGAARAVLRYAPFGGYSG